MQIKAASAGANCQYVKLERIGKGSYGQVFKCQDKQTGEVVAAKVINLEEEQLTDDVLEDLRGEVHLLSQCNSPFIVRYRGYRKGSELFGSKLWIVMEYCAGGSLRRVLELLGPLSEERVLVIGRQVLAGLEYLHAQGVVHRDVKAANLLLDMNGRIKLGDFGVAQSVNCGNGSNSLVGTPYWMAPEVIKVSTSYDQKADIWSLGITLYELIKGNPPLIHLPPTKALVVIPQSMPPRLDHTSKGLSDLVNLCLHDDPTQRPTASFLLKTKTMRGLDQKTITRVMNEIWREYHERLAKIEPDRQSLLSKEESFESWGEWRFEGDYQTIQDDQEDSPTLLSSSESSVSSKSSVERDVTKELEKRTSHLSISTVSSSSTNATGKDQRTFRLHRKTPSLLSLDLKDEPEEKVFGLPGIYYDLGNQVTDYKEKKERRELAVQLKTDRKPVVLLSKVNEEIIKRELDYVKERLDRIKRALYLISLI